MIFVCFFQAVVNKPALEHDVISSNKGTASNQPEGRTADFVHNHHSSSSSGVSSYYTSNSAGNDASKITSILYDFFSLNF